MVDPAEYYGMDDQIVDIENAAKILGVSKGTLRVWDREGKLPSIKTAGGHRRYKVLELQKFLKGYDMKTFSDYLAQIEQEKLAAREKKVAIIENRILDVIRSDADLNNKLVFYIDIPIGDITAQDIMDIVKEMNKAWLADEKNPYNVYLDNDFGRPSTKCCGRECQPSWILHIRAKGV